MLLIRLNALLAIVPSAYAATCCWSKWGDASSCGGYSGSSGRFCNNDWTKGCNGDSDCSDGPSPPTPPSPTPPSPTPPSPTPPGSLNLDGLAQWIGSSEGPCIPQGNLLVQESSGNTVAKVAFKNAPDWFVAPIWLGNAWGIAEDLTKTFQFTIVYDAETDFWIQMRSKSHWSGGAQWATRLLAGQNMSQTISWKNTTAWETPLGTPAQTLAEVLGETQGMIMVGNHNNAITVYSLKVPGFSPPAGSFIV